MSDILKKYRRNMGPEVCRQWAADAVVEIARLRAELKKSAKAALDAVALACEKEREADALRAAIRTAMGADA